MGMFSSIGGIIGTAKAKKLSKKATKAQVEAAQKGIGEVNNQWDFTQGLYNPYVSAGTTALGQAQNLIGMGGGQAQADAIAQLQQSPYYQQLYSHGEEALLQNASATGGLRGGNTQRGLADFGRDTLDQTIQNQLRNLGGMTQLGYGATGALANAGIGKADDISNLFLGQGQAKAAGYMRQAALAQQMWNNIGSLGDQAASFAAGGFGAPGGGFNLGAAMSSPGGQSLFGNN